MKCRLLKSSRKVCVHGSVVITKWRVRYVVCMYVCMYVCIRRCLLLVGLEVATCVLHLIYPHLNVVISGVELVSVCACTLGVER